MRASTVSLSMDQPFELRFPNGRIAAAARVDRFRGLARALRALGLGKPTPTLVLVGGASHLDDDGRRPLGPLFDQVLVPVVEALGAAVVDGGTDAGVMRLIGVARAACGATFPAVGVAAAETVVLPSAEGAAPDAAPLEPHHTHFILVPGSSWGDESPWLARVATALAAELASVTVLVNGGEISWQDVAQSVRAGRPVIAVDGSGRTADALARALHGESADRRANRLAASGLLRSIDPSDDPETLTREIRSILRAHAHARPLPVAGKGDGSTPRGGEGPRVGARERDGDV